MKEVLGQFEIILLKASKAVAFLLAPLCEFYTALVPMIMLALCLTLSDLKFGIEKAKKNGKEIRRSYAIRRTLNKLADFIIWVTLAGLIGNSFGSVFNVPLTSYIIMAVIYAIELESIWANYRDARGILTKDTMIDALINKFLKNGDNKKL